ncbi:MAG: nitrate reductase molybdenum cofactor assembly chaperone [Verrucomicrobiota bacterium]
MKPWQALAGQLRYPEEDLERQAEYVRTFDFDRRASLHLTYHTHGDRRQRGLELVKLKRRYADAGLELTGAELPDYLPVLLEFAALEPEAGEALLNEYRPALELVRARLHDNENPYAAVLDTIVDCLPRATKAQLARARRVAEEGPPTELVGLEPFGAAAP